MIFEGLMSTKAKMTASYEWAIVFLWQPVILDKKGWLRYLWGNLPTYSVVMWCSKWKSDVHYFKIYDCWSVLAGGGGVGCETAETPSIDVC